MLVTTTSHVDGAHVTRYVGIVTGEAIIGANIFRDFMANITDIVGGRSAAYERSLREARDMAMDEMVRQAKDKGANGVIGIDIDYETITVGKDGGGMLMVTCSGTAVVLE